MNELALLKVLIDCLDAGMSLKDFKKYMAQEYVCLALREFKSHTRAADLLKCRRGTLYYYDKFESN